MPVIGLLAFCETQVKKRLHVIEVEHLIGLLGKIRGNEFEMVSHIVVPGDEKELIQIAKPLVFDQRLNGSRGNRENVTVDYLALVHQVSVEKDIEMLATGKPEFFDEFMPLERRREQEHLPGDATVHMHLLVSPAAGS